MEGRKFIFPPLVPKGISLLPDPSREVILEHRKTLKAWLNYLIGLLVSLSFNFFPLKKRVNKRKQSFDLSVL